jgi:hypothetical protein
MGNQNPEAGVPPSGQHVAETGKIFGKRLSEYLRFQKVFLVLIAVVGSARLGLSLAGLPDSTVKWFSLTAVAAAGFVYYGVAVHTSGFGGYKQLLPLVMIQNVLDNSIVIVGIALSIVGLPNIFAAPEYGGPAVQAPWRHILGHVVGGMGIFSVVGWGVASLVMLIMKKLARRPALA